MTIDKRRKLWPRIIEKTPDWITLLPEEDQQSFQWGSGCDSFVYVPNKEKVSLRADKNVGQIFLEKISASEFKQNVFVLLVDKQLMKEEDTYTSLRFFLDKKKKFSFKVRLNAKESSYHASFDPNSGGQDLSWSKHFKGCKTNVPLKVVVSTTPQCEQEPLSVPDFPHQTPRPFTSDFESKYYNEGYILPL